MAYLAPSPNLHSLHTPSPRTQSLALLCHPGELRMLHSQLYGQPLLCSCRRNKLTLLPRPQPPATPTHSLIKCLWSYNSAPPAQNLWQRARGPHWLKEEEFKEYFFKRPTKQKVLLVLPLIWENIFSSFCFKEQLQDEGRGRWLPIGRGPGQRRKENLKIKRPAGCRMWERREIGSGGLCSYNMPHSSG